MKREGDGVDRNPGLYRRRPSRRQSECWILTTGEPTVSSDCIRRRCAELRASGRSMLSRASRAEARQPLKAKTSHALALRSTPPMIVRPTFSAMSRTGHGPDGSVRPTPTRLQAGRVDWPSGDSNDPNIAQTAPLAGNRQSARGLALLRLHVEPARCRGTSGSTPLRRRLGGCGLLDEQVRAAAETCRRVGRWLIVDELRTVTQHLSNLSDEAGWGVSSTSSFAKACLSDVRLAFGVRGDRLTHRLEQRFHRYRLHHHIVSAAREAGLTDIQ